ncbi:MAG: hypothetical protein ACKO2G_06745 [Verrucomicrobiales bacterium]
MDEYDRRQFLSTTVPGFLGVLLALPGISAAATKANGNKGRAPKDGKMNWDAFLEAVAAEAAKQHLDQWNQDDYLEKISALSLRLHREDPVLQKGFAQIRKRLEKGNVDIEYLEKHLDFAVCLVQFEKNQTIAAHDHPGMAGMILCASGKVHTRNYDLVKEKVIAAGDNRKKIECLLRKSAETTLLPNAITTLTSKARNIHSLKAEAITQLIDIFTPPYNDQRVADSRWFTIDDEPQAGSKDLFEAVVR